MPTQLLSHESNCGCGQCSSRPFAPFNAPEVASSLETPFLDTPSIVRESTLPSAAGPELESPWASHETPFQNDQFTADSESQFLAESALEWLENLHDEEFDQALFELSASLEASLGDRFSSVILPQNEVDAQRERAGMDQLGSMASEIQQMYNRWSENLEPRNHSLPACLPPLRVTHRFLRRRRQLPHQR